METILILEGIRELNREQKYPIQYSLNAGTIFVTILYVLCLNLLATVETSFYLSVTDKTGGPLVSEKGRQTLCAKQQKLVTCRTRDGCGGWAPEQPL